MKTPGRSILLLLALAACAGPRPWWKWEGPGPENLLLGSRPGPDPRDPDPCTFLGAEALRFSPERSTLAVIPSHAAPAPGEPLTVAVLARVDAFPPAKASLVSRWECAEGKRSFDLGVTREGSLYFTASAGGSWPRLAREIRTPPIPKGKPFLAAAAFLPGKCMRILVNGRTAAESVLGIPQKLFPAPTPIQLGNRAGSRRKNAFCGIIGGVWIYPSFLEPAQMEALADAEGIDTTMPILPPLPPSRPPPYDLDAVKGGIRAWYATLEVKGAPYGAYAMRPGGKPSLYASADLAWIRWICRDLEITEKQRKDWIAFLRSRRNPDGTYRHRTGHCPAHAACHVTGALHMLGAPSVPLPPFFRRYLDPEGITTWLENIKFWVLGRLYMHENYRREDIRRALALASAGLMDHLKGNRWAFFSDAHSTLSRVASLALCAEAVPGLFRARRPWRNPWSRPELFALSFKKP